MIDAGHSGPAIPSGCAAGGSPAADDVSEPRDGAGLSVVYCGGCNPHIDRGAVASELAAAPGLVRPDARVYLSGCPRACASGHQLALAGHDGVPGGPPQSPSAAGGPTVVVAGAHVDGTPAPPDAIAATVIDKLKE